MAVLSLLALAGCSSSDPQIMQVDHHLVASVPAEGGEISEALVVSIDLYDPDGAGELSQLEVRLVDSELRWTLSVDELSHHEQDGQRWFTTPFLAIEGQPRLPRGRVAITVVDLSGREDQREVQLPQTLPELDTAAAARVDATHTIVAGEGADTMVVILEAAEGRREVREMSLGNGTVPVSRVFEPAVIERVSATSEPVQLWILHEWSPRLHVESGPWEIDPSRLSPAGEP